MPRHQSRRRGGSRKLGSYLVASFPAGTIEKPVTVYEDGTVEVPTVLRVKSYLGRQYYRALSENLAHLRYKRRDLRHHFRPRDRPTYLYEVLEKKRDQKSISVSWLRKLFYRDTIESVISAILEVVVQKKWTRVINKALRERDREFLEHVGYIRKSGNDGSFGA